MDMIYLIDEIFGEEPVSSTPSLLLFRTATSVLVINADLLLSCTVDMDERWRKWERYGVCFPLIVTCMYLTT